MTLPQLPAGFDVDADFIRDAAAKAAQEILDPSPLPPDLDPDFWVEVFETVRLRLLREGEPKTRRRTAFKPRR